jgi:hypothetical protein
VFHVIGALQHSHAPFQQMKFAIFFVAPLMYGNFSSSVTIAIWPFRIFQRPAARTMTARDRQFGASWPPVSRYLGGIFSGRFIALLRLMTDAAMFFAPRALRFISARSSDNCRQAAQ